MGDSEDPILKSQLQTQLPAVCDFLEQSVMIDSARMSRDALLAIASLVMDIST